MGLAVLGGAAACGGGGGLSLEEYFTQIEELSDELETRGTDAEQTFNEELVGAQSNDEAIDAIEAFIGEAIEISSNFREGMDDLDPPSETAELHNQAVDAFDDTIAEFEEARSDLQAAESEDELLEVANDLETRFDDVTSASTEACNGLQEIAGENEIDVDLQCEDS